MWKTEYSATTDLSAHAVWNALRDIHTGAAISGGGDTFEIHGPYEIGTEISVTPQGQETFRSVIVELVEGEVYADRTEFNGLVLTFRHLFRPEGGRLTVTHELLIEGPEADQVGPELGPQISADFPDAMKSLFAIAAERRTTA
ncbi:polyketide cyclase [Nocardia terpenica]|uniref:polyketide cyclase n=1 Tax=Nocardia terpenica TaxID=455432 RepID=UPI0018938B2E|nr:polyketide cyclase [Nocardia terpenica]MBF6066107.1 polyketide cyclase [Nocardia terpenica]MBF6109202.1 polyketide cyclase [Nocardia terpenica]MBF6116351.1 polyketide cyclase [Nocardia terpenica]MBF6123508.1 polyketide cyclase [Nocardia terpenica]MBF6156785.1 polyketide cyclase [Nocardia terpenica]